MGGLDPTAATTEAKPRVGEANYQSGRLKTSASTMQAPALETGGGFCCLIRSMSNRFEAFTPKEREALSWRIFWDEDTAKVFRDMPRAGETFRRLAEELQASRVPPPSMACPFPEER